MAYGNTCTTRDIGTMTLRPEWQLQTEYSVPEDNSEDKLEEYIHSGDEEHDCRSKNYPQDFADVISANKNTNIDTACLKCTFDQPYDQSKPYWVPSSMEDDFCSPIWIAFPEEHKTDTRNFSEENPSPELDNTTNCTMRNPTWNTDKYGNLRQSAGGDCKPCPPCGPCGSCRPCGPCGPCIPCSPCGPCGPCRPCFPCCPMPCLPAPSYGKQCFTKICYPRPCFPYGPCTPCPTPCPQVCPTPCGQCTPCVPCSPCGPCGGPCKTC